MVKTGQELAAGEIARGSDQHYDLGELGAYAGGNSEHLDLLALLGSEAMPGVGGDFQELRKYIQLRSPCCAEAQGGHPWPPVRRMRRTPVGSRYRSPFWH